MEEHPQAHGNSSSNIKSILSVWLGALTLCIPAMVNNFPFLYADTGTYLSVGFRGETSEIRPMIYGLFVRHASLFESLWLVIFIQGLIISWLIHTFFRTFSVNAPGMRPLGVILVLTLMTGIAEVTGMLMPDVLTSVMILSGAILLYGGPIGWKRLIMVSVLLWFAIASHHSHAYILFIVLLGVVLIRAYQYWKKKETQYPVRKLMLVISLLLAGYFTIPILHWSYSGEFYWSKVKSVFVTNRINQMGLLEKFLQDNCQDHQYRLCADKDSIPFDFLWDANSPVRKTGGFMVNDEEYGRMLKDFFKQPYFVRKFLIRSLENGVVQFFTIEGNVVIREGSEGYPYGVIQQVWPELVPSVRRTLQFENRWSSSFIQVLQRFMVYGSYFLFLAVFVFGKTDLCTRTQKNLVGFIMLALFANAMVCGGLSMVDVRFQYRVVWLAPMLALWLIGEQSLLKEIVFRKELN